MPRTAEQNKCIKDKRREKLLSYALKAFAIEGYDHTAIDDITKPAKCSHGLFYHYFDSKESVFSKLIDEFLTGPNAVPVKGALNLGGSAGLDVLFSYAGDLAGKGTKEFYIAKITLELKDATDLDDKAKRFAKENDIEKALLTLVKQGQDEGTVIAGDPKEITLAMLDLARGAISRRIGKKDSSHISPDVLRLMFLKSEF